MEMSGHPTMSRRRCTATEFLEKPRIERWSQPTKQEGPAVGGGERVQGAARGAVGGLAIGAIAGDAGKGAAIGAVGGTMVGGHRARKNKAASEQQAEQAKAGTLQQFNKAFAVCMEGRSYSVK